MSEKIRIGMIDFEVEFVERLRDTDNVQSLAGDICYVNPKITIDSEQGRQPIYLTLWHEITHGIAYAMGMKLDEVDVDRLARGICQVLRDNPAILKKYFPKEWN